MDFNGKVAVVTGGSRGMGLAMAQGFAREGMKVVLASPEPDTLEQEVAKLREKGAQVLGVQTDVAKRGDIETLAEATVESFGGVHILCNNAGAAVPGQLGLTSDEDWRWTLSINLWGPIHGVEVFLPIMESQGEGHIISTASESGLYGVPFLAAYNVAKFGVVGLMQSLERELRARNSAVRASVLCPGAVKTDMMGSAARNRSPESMAQHVETDATKQFWHMVNERVEQGKAPEEVSKIVLEAIRQNKFWIFTHSHIAETALHQAEVMASEQLLTELK